MITSQYRFCCTEEVQLAEAFAKKEEMVGNLLNLKKKLLFMVDPCDTFSFSLILVAGLLDCFEHLMIQLPAFSN